MYNTFLHIPSENIHKLPNDGKPSSFLRKFSTVFGALRNTSDNYWHFGNLRCHLHLYYTFLHLCYKKATALSVIFFECSILWCEREKNYTRFCFLLITVIEQINSHSHADISAGIPWCFQEKQEILILCVDCTNL